MRASCRVKAASSNMLTGKGRCPSELGAVLGRYKRNGTPKAERSACVLQKMGPQLSCRRHHCPPASSHTGERGRALRMRAASQSAGGNQVASSSDSLDSLPFKSFITSDGEIDPDQKDDAQSSVFAVFDQAKQLQFIGFSKNLRNSLRTVLGRQVEFCFFYKHVDFSEVDQEAMTKVRDAWVEENHGMPPGNTAAKRLLWQQPINAGGVSERGKLVAAKQQLETILKKLKQRGVREEFVVNEDMLAEGKVDFLPAKELTEEEKQRKEEHKRRILEATKDCSTVIDGVKEDFTIFFESIFNANGGAMVDVVVTKDDLATKHRVIMGEEYIEAVNLPPQEIAEATFAFLLSKKVQRHTEGILTSNQFPINYFALSTVEQWYDDFALTFEETKLPGENKFWRFNRIHEYGDKWSALAVNQDADATADGGGHREAADVPQPLEETPEAEVTETNS